MTVAPSPPFRRALVIANPIAGNARGKRRAEELSSALTAAGLEVDLHLTSGRGDAPQRLARLEPEVDLLVVVGGDGSVGEVLSATPPGLPVAVHPMGTANVLSLDLRLPRNVAGTVAMVLAGKSTLIDVADVNGRLSFLVTGVGIDGVIVRAIDEARTGSISKLTYVKASLRHLLRYKAPRLTVEIDGELLPDEYAWVLVSNMIGYGGFMKLSPDRKLDDGLYEVFLFPRGSLTALIGYGLRGIVRHLPGGDCRMLRARSVRIDSDTATPYEVDGDFGGETPVEINVTGIQHRLLLP